MSGHYSLHSKVKEKTTGLQLAHFCNSLFSSLLLKSKVGWILNTAKLNSKKDIIMRFLLKQLTGRLKDLTLICKALTQTAVIFLSGHTENKRKINSPSVTSLKKRENLLNKVIGGSTGGQVDDPRVKEENQTETQANRRVERKE